MNALDVNIYMKIYNNDIINNFYYERLIMDAPKKIYLCPSDLAGRDYEDEWLEYPFGEDSIEYTRTDAFIEKATKWLMDNIQDYTDDGMGEHSFVLVQDLKENFKKYMEE